MPPIASFVTNDTPEEVKMYKMPYKITVPKYVRYTEPDTLSWPPLLTFSYRSFSNSSKICGVWGETSGYFRLISLQSVVAEKYMILGETSSFYVFSFPKFHPANIVFGEL